MAKRIATVDGVDHGVIKCTISLDARGTPVQGSFAQVRMDDQLWLVRIQDVSLMNPVHADDRFAPFVMSHGGVPEWSGLTDIERASAEVVSIIDANGNHIARDRNCPSGTAIETVDNGTIARFQRESVYHAVIGHVANSQVGASIINRHFGAHSQGNTDLGGYGEARHVAIFGRNGSGKSVWVLMLLTAKLAAHKSMGLIIPDTQGDFEDSTKHSRGAFQWDYKQALAAAGVTVETIKVSDIAMRSTAVLKQVLAKTFKDIYNMHTDKVSTVVGYVVDNLFDRDVDPGQLTAEIIGKEVVRQIGAAYAKQGRQEKIDDAQNVLDNPGRMRQLAHNLERNVRPFFTGAVNMADVVDDVLTKGRKIVIGMGAMPEHQQMYVMQELMRNLKKKAQKLYHTNAERSANAVVVLDEAPRWLPQSEDSEIKQIVAQALRETRKAGVGWWIVGQRPADVDKTVLAQAHMTWFGRGLTIGADAQAVERALSREGFEAYKEMQRRPGRYFWVGVGLDNNIGHDNTHIAVEPFDGNATQALMDANSHIWSKDPLL